jgi:hypothetical protein
LADVAKNYSVDVNSICKVRVFERREYVNMWFERTQPSNPRAGDLKELMSTFLGGTDKPLVPETSAKAIEWYLQAEDMHQQRGILDHMKCIANMMIAFETRGMLILSHTLLK